MGTDATGRGTTNSAIRFGVDAVVGAAKGDAVNDDAAKGDAVKGDAVKVDAAKVDAAKVGAEAHIKVLRGLESSLKTGSWGMVTNDAARCAENAELLSRKALVDAGVPLTQLFSPEHGISRYGADGKAMDDDTDPATGLPVCSLYGRTMRPPAEMLEPLSGVIFDIPDVGSRFYTYIWTLSHVMEACAEAGRPLVVLDRVNPVGGDLCAAEGPVLDVANCGSFLGRAPIPVRHSLTAGELARWLAAHWNLELDLTVITVEGWRRTMHWPDTGLPFVPTSPAMPSYESALCYPGTCLFEATNLSAGRGTGAPFQQIGAPWLKPPEQWLTDRAGLSCCADIYPAGPMLFSCEILPGVRFREVTFTPDDMPWKGEACRGIRMEVTDPAAFRPVRTGLALLTAIRQHHPESFRWKTYPTAANPTGEGHFERLVGATDIRPELERDPASFLASLPERLSSTAWQKEAEPYLCYPK